MKFTIVATVLAMVATALSAAIPEDNQKTLCGYFLSSDMVTMDNDSKLEPIWASDACNDTPHGYKTVRVTDDCACLFWGAASCEGHAEKYITAMDVELSDGLSAYKCEEKTMNTWSQ